MLEAAQCEPRFTISLKRSTQNLQLSTSCRPITPSLAHFADSSRALPEVRKVPGSDIDQVHLITSCARFAPKAAPAWLTLPAGTIYFGPRRPSDNDAASHWRAGKRQTVTAVTKPVPCPSRPRHRSAVDAGEADAMGKLGTKKEHDRGCHQRKRHFRFAPRNQRLR